MSNIQSVSIISAFPIGIIMIIMIWSFVKDAKKYLEEMKEKKEEKEPQESLCVDSSPQIGPAAQ